MIRPEKMSRVQVVGPKSVMDRVIKAMYAARAVHLVEHKAGEIDIGLPIDKAEEYSQTLVTIRALVATLGLQGDTKLSNGFKAVGVKNMRELLINVDKAKTEIGGMQTERKDALELKKKISEEMTIVDSIVDLEITLESFTKYNSINVYLGFVASAQDVDDEVAKVTDAYEMQAVRSDGKELIALFVSKKIDVGKILSKYGYSEYSITALSGHTGTPSSVVNQLKEQLGKTEQTLTRLDLNEHKLQRKWNDFLLLSEQFLNMELEKAEAPMNFGATKNMFVASGWVPTKLVADFENKLTVAGKDKLEIEVESANMKDDVPVQINHVAPVQSFAFFMRLYALPKYGEVDPTAFMFFLFPIFFGIILGDIGYGAISFLLFWFLKKKLPKAADLLNIMMLAAMWSIVFGLLFGEIFGFEEIFGYHLWHVISRLHEINTMFIISLVIGVVHINLGLLLGFVNEMKSHGLMTAVFTKVSWVMVQVGAGLSGAVMFGYASFPLYVGLIVFAVGVLMLYKGEGINGMVELPGIFSNILSYARLMAVGVASVGLAVVINDFGMKFIAQGGAMIGAGITIMILGHTLNIGLGILGGFLHPLRLHYVEFFTKFFHGGAKPYAPFGESTVRS